MEKTEVGYRKTPRLIDSALVSLHAVGHGLKAKKRPLLGHGQAEDAKQSMRSINCELYTCWLLHLVSPIRKGKL